MMEINQLTPIQTARNTVKSFVRTARRAKLKDGETLVKTIQNPNEQIVASASKALGNLYLDYIYTPEGCNKIKYSFLTGRILGRLDDFVHIQIGESVDNENVEIIPGSKKYKRDGKCFVHTKNGTYVIKGSPDGSIITSATFIPFSQIGGQGEEKPVSIEEAKNAIKAILNRPKSIGQ